MALIVDLQKANRNVRGVHVPVASEYMVFEAADGKKYLQINTFGSANRQMKGIASQTIQIDARTARQLVKIIAQEFSP